MTRLRYVADQARGPRGGHRNHRQLCMSVQTARRYVEGCPQARVLVVDLDTLLPADASQDELFQYHEAAMLHHTAEVLRLRPDATEPVAAALRTEEIATLRQAAEEWVAWKEKHPDKPLAPGNRETLHLFHVLRDMLREGRLR